MSTILKLFFALVPVYGALYMAGTLTGYDFLASIEVLILDR